MTLAKHSHQALTVTYSSRWLPCVPCWAQVLSGQEFSTNTTDRLTHQRGWGGWGSELEAEGGGGRAERADPHCEQQAACSSQEPAASHYQVPGAPQGFCSPHAGEVDRSEGAVGPWVGGRAAGPAAAPRLLSQRPAFPENTAVDAAPILIPASQAELSSTRRKQVVDPLRFAHPQPMCPEDGRRGPGQPQPSRERQWS